MEPDRPRRSALALAGAALAIGISIGTLVTDARRNNPAPIRIPGPTQQLLLDARIPSGACSKVLTPNSIKCEVNAIRRANGLPLLRTNQRLRRAARRHARDMIRRRYFAHVSPNGVSVEERARKAGFMRGARSWGLGEDIAWGSGSRVSPQATVAAWMRSPPHRAVILNPRYREGGAGIARGTPRGVAGATYVMDLGFRSGAAASRGWEDRPR
jgi:hypothetical protein